MKPGININIFGKSIHLSGIPISVNKLYHLLKIMSTTEEGIMWDPPVIAHTQNWIELNNEICYLLKGSEDYLYEGRVDSGNTSYCSIMMIGSEKHLKNTLIKTGKEKDENESFKRGKDTIEALNLGIRILGKNSPIINTGYGYGKKYVMVDSLYKNIKIFNEEFNQEMSLLINIYSINNPVPIYWFERNHREFCKLMGIPDNSTDRVKWLN